MTSSVPVQLGFPERPVKSTSTNAREAPATMVAPVWTASTHSAASAARGSWATLVTLRMTRVSPNPASTGTASR